MSVPWFEVAFGAHYPEIYARRDQAEADQCLQLLPSLAPLSIHGLPVLDLGCGDGRHLSSLREAQFNVIGLDLSAPLLNLASKRPHSPPLVRGDMRQLPFADHSFGSVLSLFTAFGYFGSLAKNAYMVQQVARVLSTGGHWFLDYFNCDKVRDELGSGEKFQRERTTKGLKITETRMYSQNESIVSKEVQLEKIPGSDASAYLPAEGLKYTEQVAVFGLDEIDKLARHQGLIRVASAGGYAGGKLAGGDRWILVYRKQQDSK